MEKFGCILQAPGGAGFLDVFFFLKLFLMDCLGLWFGNWMNFRFGRIKVGLKQVALKC